MNGIYALVLCIRIEHEYYGDAAVPVELLLPDAVFVQRYDLKMKRYHNSWEVYAAAAAVKDGISGIRVALKPADNNFYFVSGHILAGSGYDILEDAALQRMIMLRTGQKAVTVKIQSVTKYYEYILFLQRLKAGLQLRITEAGGKLAFAEPEEVEWPAGKRAIRFVSTEKVTLAQKSSYTFNLIEASRYGEHMLLSNLRQPMPDNASFYDPVHAITIYYTI